MTAATCTTPKTCSRCQTTVGSPLGHDYDALYLVAEATETEGAKYHAVCRRCGDVTDEYMPKAKSGHVLLSKIKVGDVLTKATVFEHNYGTTLMHGSCAIYVDNEFVCRVWFGETWTIPSCLKCTDVTKNRISNSTIYFESCCDYTEATCKNPATCIYCGETVGEIGPHDFENGVCTVCGEKEFVATVSGTVNSNSTVHTADDTTVSIFKAGEDTAIKTTTVSGLNGNYEFTEIKAGSYVIKIERPYHAALEIKITVEAADLTAESATIQLMGDANGDGKVNRKDYTVFTRYISEVITPEGYELAVMDLLADGKFSTKDLTVIKNHVIGTTPLF